MVSLGPNELTMPRRHEVYKETETYLVSEKVDVHHKNQGIKDLVSSVSQ